MQTVLLPCGERVPAFGLGTWRMGESASRRREEVAIVREALDLGVRLVDTAEMYGEGGAEEAIGEAIEGRREGLCIVSKVYPHNASRKGVVAACERSLRRLRTDRIDLYLLHWRGEVPLGDTVRGFEALQAAGKIRHWGVSNLDLADMQALAAVPGGTAVQANQLLYNLTRRGIEWDLLPWLRARGIPVMAYSPLEQARMLDHPALQRIAREGGMTPAQLALAWLCARGEVIVIPKTVNPARLRENLAAADLGLPAGAEAALDEAFPPPEGPGALEML